MYTKNEYFRKLKFYRYDLYYKILESLEFLTVIYMMRNNANISQIYLGINFIAFENSAFIRYCCQIFFELNPIIFDILWFIELIIFFGET